MTPIIELSNESWLIQLKKELRGAGPDFFRILTYSHDWQVDRERERWGKNKNYTTLARLPNGKTVKALALRDILKVIEPKRLEYTPDRLVIHHDLGKAELIYQDN